MSARLSLSLPSLFGNVSLGTMSYQQTASHDSDDYSSEPVIQHNRMISVVPSDIEVDSDADVDSRVVSPILRGLEEERRQSITRKIREIQRKSERNKKIKEAKSVKDLWSWYIQHPVGHLPFLFFFITCFLSFIFIIYWFMDQDSCFILCGILGLIMSTYAVYKFKTSIRLKKEVDHYAALNLKFKKENIRLVNSIKLAAKAIIVLKKTKKRIRGANDKNRRNLKKFESVETNMKAMGQKLGAGSVKVFKQTANIKQKWRENYLANERAMLHTVFERYGRENPDTSKYGMTEDDFKKFQSMLPKRYALRFKRLGTFQIFACGKKMIDVNDFANTLDVFAEMETDGIDLYLTPQPKQSKTPYISSFNFTLTPINPMMPSPMITPLAPIASAVTHSHSQSDNECQNDTDDYKFDRIRHYSIINEQEHEDLCWKCEAKMNGYKERYQCVKCGYIFCTLHQRPDQHECPRAT